APSPPGTQAAPPPQHPTPAPSDYITELKKLAELRDMGILTDEEFEAKKKQLLGL
ncbi:MAG: SHOCT domain-containing protein, partial [Anaerolineae bacterium]|nr:SHOCT domain-containing protein [Anaerolineae bacterium]